LRHDAVQERAYIVGGHFVRTGDGAANCSGFASGFPYNRLRPLRAKTDSESNHYQEHEVGRKAQPAQLPNAEFSNVMSVPRFNSFHMNVATCFHSQNLTLRELDQSGVRCDRCDLVRSRSVGDVQIRLRKKRVIEGVEELGAELDAELDVG